jgi:hypothetical protein
MTISIQEQAESTVMTERQFKARWDQQQDQRKAEARAVAGKWDQADAQLMVESGLTQEQIAEIVGCHRTRVHQLLLFGRFIVTSGNNHHIDSPGGSIPSNLTERAFRNAWIRTPKQSETERFKAVRKVLETDCELDPLGLEVRAKGRGQVTKHVIASLLDQDWMSRDDVHAILEEHQLTDEQFRRCLADIRNKNYAGCQLEEKTVRGKEVFRITKLACKRQVRSQKVIHFLEQAAPLIKEGKELASHNTNSISPQSILRAFILIERLMKELREELDSE